ncbi:MAG TPA: zinc-binding dehydrogenase [Chitinophagales bacterium]|nr:zinc-binding dehydrogenase [Chitinophagales bacterium]
MTRAFIKTKNPSQAILSPLAQFTAQANTHDLQTLATLIHTRKISVRVEKVYPYTKLPAAISYIEAMRTRGKVAMVWNNLDGLTITSE